MKQTIKYTRTNTRKRFVLGAVMLGLLSISIVQATDFKEMPVRTYHEMMHAVKRGWNTWDMRSMFTQLYLPHGFAVKIAMEDGDGRVADAFRVGNTDADAPEVHPYTHTFDGSYREVDATWHGLSVKVRATSTDDRLVMVITPTAPSETVTIRINPEFAWNHFSNVSRAHHVYVGERAGDCDFRFLSIDRRTDIKGHIVGEGKRFSDGAFRCAASSPIVIYTGDSLTLQEAERLLQERKEAFVSQNKARYGNSYEVFNAMQSILAWDTVYDPIDDVVVAPVSRNWCLRWSLVKDFGGYMLFDWDTFFASQMFAACGSREMAYSNAIEVLFSVDKLGFVPKWRSHCSNFTEDCSQPPVGSMAVWRIYEQFHEKWFLELAYDRLVAWNGWWLTNRMTDGLLCWGSNKVDQRWGEPNDWSTNQAVLESGLDNSQMYDGIQLDKETSQLQLQDVGLTSLYVMDCDYLSRIARELGHAREAKTFTKRADGLRKAIQRYWCEEDGMFYNLSTIDGSFNKRTSCTNFYVLLAKAATDQQARRIVSEHLTDETEFWGEWVVPMAPKDDPAYQDQSYWRGRIWGPTNFLVYMGLRNYGFPDVRAAMAEKSTRLLMKDWLTKGYIYENWNAINGRGDDKSNSDWFYHWGALLGYISFIENND